MSAYEHGLPAVHVRAIETSNRILWPDTETGVLLSGRLWTMRYFSAETIKFLSAGTETVCVVVLQIVDSEVPFSIIRVSTDADSVADGTSGVAAATAGSLGRGARPLSRSQAASFVTQVVLQVGSVYPMSAAWPP